MNLTKNILAFCSVILLGACSLTGYNDIDALNEVEPVGSPFTQALSGEYKAMSNKEMDQMFDYPDALHFARKGLASAGGHAVMPEPVTDWNLSNEDIGILQSARNRLVVVYDLGARELAPELSAVAQARFDCWIEEQEERWRDPTIPCKQEFLAALSELEAITAQYVPAKTQLPPPPMPEPITIDTTQPMMPEDAVYLVFFNFDKSNLTSGANSVIDSVSSEASKFPPSGIQVVGHTDTSGAKTYNQRLSLRRANTVRQALVERGVDPSIIFTDAKGETDLMVQTADGTREPANRRATITFQ